MNYRSAGGKAGIETARPQGAIACEVKIMPQDGLPYGHRESKHTRKHVTSCDGLSQPKTSSDGSIRMSARVAEIRYCTSVSWPGTPLR